MFITSFIKKTLILCIALSLSACITRHLSPRTPPSRTLPKVTMPAEPPAEGSARVVFDVKDGPSLLHAKYSGGQGIQGWKRICQTPCVADLPLGYYDLSYKRGAHKSDTDTLNLSPGTLAHRRALGDRDISPVMLYSGYTLATIGLSVLLAGVISAASDSQPANDAALPLGLVGGGLTILGGTLWYFGSPSVQEGATTRWQVK